MLTEAILLEQNKRLRAENDELRETVRQMQKVAESAPLPAGLPYLTAKEEALVRSLLRHHGWVSHETIYTDLYGHDHEVDVHIVQVFVSHTRRKLAGTGYWIGTVWGRGYQFISREAVVKKALRGQELSSAEVETMAA